MKWYGEDADKYTLKPNDAGVESMSIDDLKKSVSIPS